MGGSDPFPNPPCWDHPHVWVFDDVAKGRESDVSVGRGSGAL